jgi:hypothetical protein
MHASTGFVASGYGRASQSSSEEAQMIVFEASTPTADPMADPQTHPDTDPVNDPTPDPEPAPDPSEGHA